MLPRSKARGWGESVEAHCVGRERGSSLRAVPADCNMLLIIQPLCWRNKGSWCILVRDNAYYIQTIETSCHIVVSQLVEISFHVGRSIRREDIYQNSGNNMSYIYAEYLMSKVSHLVRRERREYKCTVDTHSKYSRLEERRHRERESAHLHSLLFVQVEKYSTNRNYIFRYMLIKTRQNVRWERVWYLIMTQTYTSLRSYDLSD